MCCSTSYYYYYKYLIDNIFYRVYKSYHGRCKMRIKHHYCLENKRELVRFLEKFQIAYEIYEQQEIKYNVCIFDLYEDQEAYKKFKLKFPFITKYDSINSIEYSKEEIENAEWLTVRNSSIKVQWKYEEEAFIQSCAYKRLFIKDLYYRHSKQTGLLSADQPVKWDAKHFFSGPNATDDIIFCSERTKQILGNRWDGLELWPVKKSNSSKYIPDLYQLFFAQELPIEAIDGGELRVCKGCGRKMIRIRDEIYQLKIRKEYLTDQNKVFKTADVLTADFIRCTTFSVNIVSQKFYQYCESRQMNRGMIYEPIHLV